LDVCSIYLIYLVDSLQQQITGVFRPFVTSNFNLHSLTATTGVLSNLISGLARLPLSKILDVWGRAEGFSIMVFFLTIGLVMMAACDSVETFCAAQVFYWVGYTGITYVLAVVISDTTSLKNRGLMFGIMSTPFIYTTWAGGPAAENFIAGPGWRWGFGSFAIITPVVCMSLPIVFWLSSRKASQRGLIKPRAASGRSVLQSIWFYTVELDLLGLLLICAGLSLFLLPASLYSYQKDQWRSPMIICMLVFGILLLIIFGLYERFFAPKSFLPMGMLFDRTVFGSCVYAALAFASFYIWNSYFFSFLVVVQNQTITHASYITNIYSIGSCFWAVIVGLLIRYSGRFKWLPLYFGVPMSVLGVALMVVFRQPNVNIGYIIMCQIFIAFGGGTTVITQQLAATAAVDHGSVAVVLAIQYAFANVGGAIGQSISAAIWTGVFPDRLMRYLPEDAIENFASIYGDMTVQSSYPWGSPARSAINQAYGDAQHYMLIGGACFLAFGFFFVLIWRDISVKHSKQTKGNVF
jgi:MFS family permease